MDWWFVKISLWHRHALMVEDGAFSNKRDYVTFLKMGIQIALTVLKLWRYCWMGGFSIRKGMSAACEAGLFRKGGRHKGSPSQPVPSKPSILYSRGRFVDILDCELGPRLVTRTAKKRNHLKVRFWSKAKTLSKSSNVNKNNPCQAVNCSCHDWNIHLTYSIIHWITLHL